jgi:hypothetical protein
VAALRCEHRGGSQTGIHAYTIHRHVQGAFRTTNSELTVVHVLGREPTVVGRPCAPMLSLGADATTVLLAAPAMSFKTRDPVV